MKLSSRPVAAVLVMSFLLAFGLGSTFAADTKLAKRYQKLYFKASAKAEKNRWDDVLRLAGKMQKVGPEGTLHWTYTAQAQAQLGEPEAAFEALEKMIAPGWTNADGLSNIEHLDPLHDDARFEKLSQRAAEMGEAWKESMRTLHRRLPVDEAETFASAEEIGSRFEQRRNELNRRSMLMPNPVFWTRLQGLNDQEIASAWRYVKDHPEADDADMAGLSAVRAANRYKSFSAYLDGDAAIVLDTAERFLKNWPESEHRPEVELARGIATWKACGEDDRETSLERRAREADALFVALNERFGDAPEATKARIWRVNIAMELSDGEVTSEISDLYGTIQPAFEDDTELEGYAWEEAPRAMFQINGRERFDGIDLDGKHWNWDAMQGKVVLIDFWATWCGPCIADIPHIKETYDRYHDAGFEIVGVSLDGDDEETFLKECDKLGVEWPQIFDGKGWDNELARSFNIWGVPTPVLIDRNGKVVGVHEDVRGENLIEQVGKLID